MNWFNYSGLAIVAIIMVPNIVYAIKRKAIQEPSYSNRTILILEQIGRFGCLLFMVFNIPYTYFNFYFDHALIVYLAINGMLCLAYCIEWIVFWKRNGQLKALFLSITPSLIFLFSGIILANIPLIVFALLFTISHVNISYKNSNSNSNQ